MVAPGKPALRDVAILTRAVEKVFRKLVRMLIGKMSLKKLQELIQIIFIEEAEAKLKQEAPGKSVALGDIAYKPVLIHEPSRKPELTSLSVTRCIRMIRFWMVLCPCSRCLICG